MYVKYIHSGTTIHVADGIEFVQKYRGLPFDIIVHDVFTGGAVPSSLFTIEFFNKVKVCSH